MCTELWNSDIVIVWFVCLFGLVCCGMYVHKLIMPSKFMLHGYTDRVRKKSVKSVGIQRLNIANVSCHYGFQIVNYVQVHTIYWMSSGDLTVSYWKLPFIVISFPSKNGDSPWLSNSLPEGTWLLKRMRQHLWKRNNIHVNSSGFTLKWKAEKSPLWSSRTVGPLCLLFFWDSSEAKASGNMMWYVCIYTHQCICMYVYIYIYTFVCI